MASLWGESFDVKNTKDKTKKILERLVNQNLLKQII